MEEDMESLIRARLDRACNFNKVLGGNLFKLLRDYEKDGQPAINEADKFDWDSLLDNTLRYYEHRQRIEKFLEDGGYMNLRASRMNEYEKMLLEAKVEVGKEEEEERKVAYEAQSEATQASFEAAILKVSEQNGDADTVIAEQIPAFRSFFAFVDMLLGNSDYTHGAILYGDSGTGKTRGVMSRLARAGVPYAVYNSYSTPLAFYEMLYRNNGKTIVLDDVNTLLKNPLAIAILKAALFSVGTERLITYSSTAKVLEDRGLPAQFIFCGRVIVILNEIPTSLRETFQALLSRVYEYKLQLTKEEKLKLVSIVFKTSDVFGLSLGERQTIFDFMRGILDFSNLHRFNVRTALRAAEIWKLQGAEKAKPMIMDLMETDLKLKAFVMIEEGGAALPVGAKVHIWEETTGYSRRSYFDVKARHNRTHYGRDAIEWMLRADIKESLDAWVRS